jgi:hypothetical protein
MSERVNESFHRPSIPQILLLLLLLPTTTTTTYTLPTHHTTPTMRYSLVATTLLATSTLSLALPTVSSLLSPFQDSLALPSYAEKVLSSIGHWGNGQDDEGVWEGMSIRKINQGGVDCESFSSFASILVLRRPDLLP